MPVKEISTREAHQRQQRGAVLVDVRESHEHALGTAEGALAIPRAELERHPLSRFPDRSQPIVLVCQSGGRSRLAAEVLLGIGYTQVASVRGGMAEWISAGLPTTRPKPEIDTDFHERYSRHLLLPEVGARGQRTLEAASVVLFGAGGLGSPVAFYLAAAGVGTLRVVDDDAIDRSNLQRQVLHADADVGAPKAESASTRLLALNPRIRVEAVTERATSSNIDRLLDGMDLVVDGTDNFAARYLFNDACVKHALPLVYGAVHRFEGQASVFDAGRHRGKYPCYRCLFPEPPAAQDAPNCAEAGVLGVLPGVIGMLQATEAIKLLLHLGEPLRGRLLQFDALAMRFRETRVPPDPACPVCAPGKPFPGYIDYEAFCAAGNPATE